MAGSTEVTGQATRSNRGDKFDPALSMSIRSRDTVFVAPRFGRSARAAMPIRTSVSKPASIRAAATEAGTIMRLIGRPPAASARTGSRLTRPTTHKE
jgi:hypothetical protein